MNKKILVIGESCKDIFVYCSSVRLAPDVPVPVLNVLYQKENEGMAKNVQRNILQITKQCDIKTNENWESITKTRFIDEKSNHMFIRVDSDHSCINRINLKEIDFSYDLIAISDYDKGYLKENDIKKICDNHKNVFLDTKKIIGQWAKNAKFIKINDYEFKRSQKYMDNSLIKKTIHTAGEEGCYFNDICYPVNKSEVKDTSGAGDSFFAALIVKFAETNNIIKAIEYANLCASKVVQQKGVTTIK